ncbi:hypothetical protein G3I40_20480 [Streptomyces sp. SID14478]|uniref:hypothetical protein n=1 Tax=Streptomyces sp. SID14478 TaxID=2706073 RepID=UPI0013DD2AA5|nr:hypothetical protein [Streptomyces sp. SID14478]NEB77574.1 hypothetical protein [Streptomyces sp. SID14478]
MRGVLIGVLGAVAVVGVAAAVAVPAAEHWYDGRHEQTSTYASGKEAKEQRESVPRWLPDDATSVTYAMRTTGGERILKATLGESRLPAQCQPLGGRTAPPPEISASWFPADADDTAKGRCGSYYVSLDSNTLYAWQTNKDWVAKNHGTEE